MAALQSQAFPLPGSAVVENAAALFAANNLFDSHNIVGVTPFTAATASAPFVPNSGDLLNLLPGRSVMVTFTVGYAPRR